VVIGLLAVVCACVGVAMPAQGWCEQPFREIAVHADRIVLAEYRKPRGADPELRVLEVLHGEPLDGTLNVDAAQLAPHRPRNRTLFLMALNGRRGLLAYLEHLGVCRPVPAVPLRGGKLHGDDRFAYYDNDDDAMTLEQLRGDLARLFQGR